MAEAMPSGRKRGDTGATTPRATGQTRAHARTGGDWGDRLIAELRKWGTLRIACRKAGVGRSTVYERMAKDRDFRLRVEIVRAELFDVILSEMLRRGMEGDRIETPIYVQGDNRPDGTPVVVLAGVKTEVRRSDRLLAILAKLLMPEIFGPIPHGFGTFDPLSPSGRDVVKLARLLAPDLGMDAGAVLRAAAQATGTPR